MENFEIQEDKNQFVSIKPVSSFSNFQFDTGRIKDIFFFRQYLHLNKQITALNVRIVFVSIDQKKKSNSNTFAHTHTNGYNVNVLSLFSFIHMEIIEFFLYFPYYLFI